jgi:hypothetical protein
MEFRKIGQLKHFNFDKSQILHIAVAKGRMTEKLQGDKGI